MLSRLSGLVVLLYLAACGFTPMYGNRVGENNKIAAQELSMVDIALIPNADGVFLRNILIDNFYQNGYPSNPRLQLNVANIQVQETDLDITIDSETTRKQIKLTTTLDLKEMDTGKIVLTKPIYAITSYNVLDSQFTTRVSEQDVKEAALQDLARQIETQVLLYLRQ